MRGTIDVGAGALQNVGCTVDHRVEQSIRINSPVTVGAQVRASLLTIMRTALVLVAHGDELVPGENERNGRWFLVSPYPTGTSASPSCSARHSRRRAGSTPRSPASLARRHPDAVRAFEQLVFGECWCDQIEPDRTFGHGAGLIDYRRSSEVPRGT